MAYTLHREHSSWLSDSFQIYDSIRKNLEKLLLQFHLKENNFSGLIPGVLMALDLSDTYHSPGYVALKTI